MACVGIVPPRTPMCLRGLSWIIGSISASKTLKRPNRYSLVGINDCDVVMYESFASSSSHDSQSSSSSANLSPSALKILFVLLNLSIFAGRSRLKLFPCVGTGLLSSWILFSSTNPTSVNIDMRRPSARVAGCARTRSMTIKYYGKLQTRWCNACGRVRACKERKTGRLKANTNRVSQT
jgi:hypothetical protein